MKIRSFAFVTILFFPMVCAFSQANASQGFAVLELFTSQGCSSCPPADEVLGKYALKNDLCIFPLSFHVDYWDRIGWKDPFSKRIFTDKQRRYSESLNTNTYTPQLVINGTVELVGSNEKNVFGLVESVLKSVPSDKIEITSAVLSENHILIKYKYLTDSKDIYLNAALVKKKMTTVVKRGENSGRTLTNYNIVYDFINEPFTNLKPRELSFDFKGKDASEYFIVIYTQEKQAGRILAAAKSDIK